MNRTKMAALLAPLACIAASLPALAGGGSHWNGDSRTYFGRPGVGPYGPGGGSQQRYEHPWTGKIFGIRWCCTAEDQQERLQRKHSIEQARHEAAMNRIDSCPLNGKRDCNAQSPDVVGCNCNTGCGKANGCGKSHGCGKASGCGGCDSCGEKHAGLLSGMLWNRSGRGCGNGGCGNGGGYQGGSAGGRGNNYPPMNREDATRYIEGFQYYPPYHIVRSPRDFYMFDVKYGVGR